MRLTKQKLTSIGHGARLAEYGCYKAGVVIWYNENGEPFDAWRARDGRQVPLNEVIPLDSTGGRVT